MVDPDEIKQRFDEEQGYIQGYLDLLTSRLIAYDSEIDLIINRLATLGLLDTTSVPSRGWARRYTQSDLEQLDQLFQGAKPELERRLEECRNRVKSAPLDNIAAMSPDPYENEVVEVFVRCIEDTPGYSADDVGHWIQQAREQAESDIAEQGEDAPLAGPDLNTLIPNLFEYARRLADLKAQAMLAALLRRIDQTTLIRKAGHQDDSLNVYRQAFISLVTAFDATVFDLTRLAIQRDFFRLIPTIADDARLSIKDLAAHKDFDAMRESIIEARLKPKYLKDLLLMLDKQGVGLVDPATGLAFAHLMEMVLRRNLHMHNRGVVDVRYVETKDGSPPQFNVYGLQLGDVAGIDLIYWHRALILCERAVASITAWVKSLPAP